VETYLFWGQKVKTDKGQGHEAQKTLPAWFMHSCDFVSPGSNNFLYLFVHILLLLHDVDLCWLHVSFIVHCMHVRYRITLYNLPLKTKKINNYKKLN